MADILMPQLGETVTEGTITKWFKQIGDPVGQDEILFEVSTEKVDSEVPSTASGTLLEIRVVEGTTVGVGTVLAVIGESSGAAAPTPPPVPPAAPTQAPPEAASPPPIPPPQSVGAGNGAAPLTVAASLAGADGSGTGGTALGEEPRGRLLSPIVRRLVAENGIDITRLTPSGPGGRITRLDVERAIEVGSLATTAAATAAAAARVPATTAPAASAVAVAAPAAPQATAALRRGDQRVPLSRIRRLTGDHMVNSKSVSPHVLTAMEVDFEAVERVRSAARDSWRAEEGFSLTYLPFISRAVADALREFPAINASMGDGELIVHGDLNLAIAVDLSFEGLVAPVVKQADSKRLRAIAREIHDLANRARSRQLRPDDISGGTFTITNPGQYGTLMQFPIINQPQVAILATDGVKRRPVVVTDRFGDESIGIHSVGVLALAWDHRAFDGAFAAAFLARLRDIIETRDWADEVL